MSTQILGGVLADRIGIRPITMCYFFATFFSEVTAVENWRAEELSLRASNSDRSYSRDRGLDVGSMSTSGRTVDGGQLY